MIKKICSILIGVLAVVAIIYTGYLSFADESGYLTALYGVVAVVLAPSAFSFIQWAFKKPDKTLQDLKKVPEIRKLLEKVKQYEEMVKNLKDERDKLLEIIQKESTLFMLQERKASLEKNILTTQEELAEIDALLHEEPNANFKYLPDIIKRIESETYETELTLEAKLLNIISVSLRPNSLLFSIVYELSIWLYKKIDAIIARQKNKKDI